MNKLDTSYDNSLDRQIRLEEIRLLFGGTPFSYTASVVIAFIIYYVLLGHTTSETSLNIWLATILTVLLIRSIESYRFSRLNEDQQQENDVDQRSHVDPETLTFRPNEKAICAC